MGDRRLPRPPSLEGAAADDEAAKFTLRPLDFDSGASDRFLERSSAGRLLLSGGADISDEGKKYPEGDGGGDGMPGADDDASTRARVRLARCVAW
jgi:hypothetical protein